jgi:UPF0755 protein
MTWLLPIFFNLIWIEYNPEMAPKQSSSCLRTVVILFLLFLCLSVTGTLSLLTVIPDMAAEEFGPASRNLDSFNRALYSARLLLQKNDLTLPVDSNGVARKFRIQDGETVNLIALHLEDAGLIRDAGAFRFYLIYSGSDVNLKSGEFTLSPAVNPIEIAKALQDVKAKDAVLGILAGWRVEEVAAGLAATGLSLKPEDFLQEIANPSPNTLPQSLVKFKNLEGFLFPGTYSFQRNATAADVLAVVTEQFDQQVTDELRQGFQRQGLDLYQAVTLASLIQREAMMVDEQPMIASVFYNRLRKNMKLDSDPTVQYALGYNAVQKTWWTNPLSLKDLKIDSPYNTYIQTGLPPSPIASPSLSALRAVAFPAQSPYFYFQARCDGSRLHNFAVTYTEHLKNSCP